MGKDWKDMLSSLRESFQTPDDEVSVPEITENIEQGIGKQKETLRIVTDKKGRNGKVATIIEGFTLDQKEIESIAHELKKRLGVGGSTRNGEILVQGDHKQKVKEFLEEKNFKIKLI